MLPIDARVVAGLTSGDEEPDRALDGIDDGVPFRGHAAVRAPDQPFTPFFDCRLGPRCCAALFGLVPAVSPEINGEQVAWEVLVADGS
tara:strand:- start:13 stop:276 length:264 start_codon:yes stop_codon:yes gene_type:complete